MSILTCPLCELKKETRWYSEDAVCVVANCKTHPDKIIVVLRRHSETPTPEEEQHIREVIAWLEKLFPGIKFRGPASIKEHWHLHEV